MSSEISPAVAALLASRARTDSAHSSGDSCAGIRAQQFDRRGESTMALSDCWLKLQQFEAAACRHWRAACHAAVYTPVGRLHQLAVRCFIVRAPATVQTAVATPVQVHVCTATDRSRARAPPAAAACATNVLGYVAVYSRSLPVGNTIFFFFFLNMSGACRRARTTTIP